MKQVKLFIKSNTDCFLNISVNNISHAKNRCCVSPIKDERVAIIIQVQSLLQLQRNDTPRR